MVHTRSTPQTHDAFAANVRQRATLRRGAPLAAVMLASLLAACAGTGGHAALPLQERLAQQGLVVGESLQRVPSFGISGWSYLDKRHVQVNSGPGRQYLIETSIDCEELAFADRLAYTTTGGALTRFDRLLARSNSGWPINCGVQSIHQLERLEKTASPDGDGPAQ